MIQKKLSSNPKTYYGTNVNYDRTHILLQFGDEHGQVRVGMTVGEVDQLIISLKRHKETLRN